MTDDELRAIAERAERAPPGPWEFWTGCSWRRFGVAGTLHRVLEPAIDPFDGHPDLIMADGVADFVAHAREDIPRLLAALAQERELRAAERDGAAEAWKRLDAAYQQERARADAVRRSNAALVEELDSARERALEDAAAVLQPLIEQASTEGLVLMARSLERGQKAIRQLLASAHASAHGEEGT